MIKKIVQWLVVLLAVATQAKCQMTCTQIKKGYGLKCVSGQATGVDTLSATGIASKDYVNNATTGIGTAALTATFIGYGSGTNLLTGSSSFTWNNTAKDLTVNGTVDLIINNTGNAAYIAEGNAGYWYTGPASTGLLSHQGFGIDLDGRAKYTMGDVGITNNTHIEVDDVAQTVKVSTLTGGTTQIVSASTVGALGVVATTGTGNVVLSASPVLTTPNIGTPSAGVLTNCTGLPLSGIVNIADQTILGNNSGGVATPSALTASQARTIQQNLGSFTCFHTQIAAPVDATNYHFGACQYDNTATASTGLRLTECPFAITVIGVSVQTSIGTTGSAEISTMYLRVAGSDNALISTVKYDVNGATFSATGLSIAITAGQSWEIKWTSPTWVTNPLTAKSTVTLWYYRN